MHPAIPKAIGSFAAVSEIMFTIDEMLRNAGTLTAIKITEIAIIIYIALLNSRSVTSLFLSPRSAALNFWSQTETRERFTFFALVSAMMIPP